MDKEGVEVFKKLRDVCDDVVNAYEKDDVKELESAIGRFLFLCMEMQAMK